MLCEEVKKSYLLTASFSYSSPSAYDSGSAAKSAATLQKECGMSKQLIQLRGAEVK